MKIGSKIIAITDNYAPDVVTGSVMTVKKDHGDGDVNAMVDGGDGYGWYMNDGTYEPYTPKPKTTGTLKELNVKPGDVVQADWKDGGQHTIISAEVITEGNFTGMVIAELSEFGQGIFDGEQFTIISRAADTPASLENLSAITTVFGLLDVAIRNAMQAAWDSGLDVKKYIGSGWVVDKTPSWNPLNTYCIASKPTMLTLTRNFGVSGRHIITCRQDGSEPTVEWVADK